LIITEEKKLVNIYLYPAALITMEISGYVHTILGSCVSVCLYDEVRKTGGINHYMLPFWNGDGLPTPKYGNIAIQKLLEKMISIGSRKEHLVAKIFVGGEVIESLNQSFNIGRKNIAIAVDMLNELKIPIIAQSTGGNLGRKIIFNTYSGEVIHRFVKSTKTK
jgi:chemotaxis protein CheD